MNNANIKGNNSMLKANILGYTPTKASETERGLLRIATEEEAKQGIIKDVAITPYTLKQTIAEITGQTTYVHEQNIAEKTWIINHGMNKNPSITIVDSADNVVIGEEEYIDENNLVIKFKNSFKGKAYLN